MQIAILFMENRNAKGPIVHFKCPSTDLKCWSKKVNLHFCRLASTYYVYGVCTRKLLECQRKEWLFPSFSTFSAWDAKLPSYPSQNTQSCIKGLLVVQDFCFWAIWAARPVLKIFFDYVIICYFWGWLFMFSSSHHLTQK